jgi:large subunit ribosomal protein L15
MSMRAPHGAVKKRRIVGRGQGTGRGCTCGRGNNGQKSRSGYSQKIGFEGGQMPLARRIPKRGFNNSRFERQFQIINIRDLAGFNDDDVIDYKVLLSRRLVNRKPQFIKLLGHGELDKKLHVKVNRISQKAREAVEHAGGDVEVLG